MTTTAKATFGAGCFWGVQAAFDKIPGVLGSVVGYTGGKTEHPTYQEVCTDKTGHAEAIEIEYDPDKVGYEELLQAFWQMHDPTTLNRQGPDVGAQYRSAIFYHSEEQRRVTEESKKRLEASGKLKRPVVTEITPAARFWPAEEYHQKYYEKRGGGACPIR